MRSKLSLLAASTLLLVFSCQKEVNEPNSPAEQKFTGISTGGPVLSTAVSQTCDMLSFSSPNQAGIGVTQVTSDNGMMIMVSASTSVASIMNSAAPPSNDKDMGTPNVMYGGPGEADPGKISGAATNNTAWGNLLILQWPGFTSYPNEADLGSPGAYIDLTFPSDVTAKSIQVIDVESDEAEGGSVTMMDAGNSVLGTVPISATGSNGVGTINLGNTQNVRKIRLQIIGSMGFDNLSFCMPLGHCTYTVGYWKNHPDAWPVSSLMLGTVNYTKSQLLSILSEPVRGNGLISLAHQLIAAKLNAANGSNTSALGSAISSADAMIGSKVVPPIGSGFLAPGSTSDLTSKLASFNEGEIGPGHCE